MPPPLSAVCQPLSQGFAGGSDGKESACNAGNPGLMPGLGSTPVLLPGVFHGQRSLMGYSPWVHKESDLTEQVTLSLSLFTAAFHTLNF